MAIPSFFKQIKPRGYNYIPRYYDPEKEKREERLRALKPEHGEGDTPSSAAKPPEGDTGQPYRSKIMRGDMKNYFHRKNERIDKHTTIRLIVIVLVIVLIVYVYLHFNFLR